MPGARQLDNGEFQIGNLCADIISAYRFVFKMSELINSIEDTSIEPAEYMQQPVWHVVVLSIVSCFAYSFYWYYKTWRDLKSEALNKRGQDKPELEQFADTSPMLRTLGLVVPVFNIYMAVSLIKAIAELNPSENSYTKKHPLVSAGLVMGAIIALLCLYKLPGALFMLSFTAAVPLSVVQFWLNKYWRSVESPGRFVRHAFTGKELIVVILGGLLLGLDCVGVMCGVTAGR